MYQQVPSLLTLTRRVLVTVLGSVDIVVLTCLCVQKHGTWHLAFFGLRQTLFESPQNFFSASRFELLYRDVFGIEDAALQAADMMSKSYRYRRDSYSRYKLKPKRINLNYALRFGSVLQSFGVLLFWGFEKLFLNLVFIQVVVVPQNRTTFPTPGCQQRTPPLQPLHCLLATNHAASKLTTTLVFLRSPESLCFVSF